MMHHVQAGCIWKDMKLLYQTSLSMDFVTDNVTYINICNIL